GSQHTPSAECFAHHVAADFQLFGDLDFSREGIARLECVVLKIFSEYVFHPVGHRNTVEGLEWCFLGHGYFLIAFYWLRTFVCHLRFIILISLTRGVFLESLWIPGQRYEI